MIGCDLCRAGQGRSGLGWLQPFAWDVSPLAVRRATSIELATSKIRSSRAVRCLKTQEGVWHAQAWRKVTRLARTLHVSASRELGWLAFWGEGASGKSTRHRNVLPRVCVQVGIGELVNDERVDFAARLGTGEFVFRVGGVTVLFEAHWTSESCLSKSCLRSDRTACGCGVADVVFVLIRFEPTVGFTSAVGCG